MKKIMLAAVAASFVSTGASAVQLPAEGEVCSSIHSNISVGINNPELSDYRKCVMIQHDIDTAFTYKTFWVRTGDTFTSFPVETLAKMNRGERIDYIKNGVTQELVTKLLEEQREELETAHAIAIEKLATAHANEIQMAALTVADLTKQIRDLNDSIEMIKTAHAAAITVSFNEGAASRDAEIAELTQERNAARAEVTRLERELADERATTLQLFGAGIAQADRITELETRIDELNAQIDALEAMPVGATPAELEAAREEGRAQASSTYVAARQRGEDKSVEITRIFRDGGDGDASDVVGLRYEQADETYDLDTKKGTDDIAGLILTSETSTSSTIFGTYTTVTVELDGETHRIRATIDGPGPISLDAAASATVEAFVDGFDQGYDRGYDDGFKDGYKVGYADGFEDGVGSTR